MRRALVLLFSVLAAVLLVGFASASLMGMFDAKLATANELAPSPADSPKMRNVAILLYDRVELLDFAGPGEVFAAAGGRSTFKVFTVAATEEPIHSQGFVEITPEYSIANSPRPDILVIPGGGVGNVLHNPQLMGWIKKTAEEAEIVLSVCNGALVLAQTGLLDGLEVTTHHGSLERLRRMASQATVHDDRRYVDNGRIITSAGVSAGIDSSLYVVARLLGEDAARQTAWYMEYNWQPDN